MYRFRAGNGAAWLDLLTTVSGRYRDEQVDAISEPPALRAWLRAYALEPIGAATPDDVELVGATREALHRVAVAALRDDPPAAPDVRSIEQALAADQGIRIGAGAQGLRIRRPATVAEALGRLVRDAVQDLAGPQRAYLHACGDDMCSGIFLDHGGRRRWCSDQSCGNRARVRAHRARARSSAPTS